MTQNLNGNTLVFESIANSVRDIGATTLGMHGDEGLCIDQQNRALAHALLDRWLDLVLADADTTSHVEVADALPVEITPENLFGEQFDHELWARRLATR